MLIFLFFLFQANANYDLPLGEPRIECTVVKIISDQLKFGDTGFPKLYHSIYNDNLKSALIVGNKELKNINPEQFLKTSNLEKIKIKYGNDELALEIMGRPISRNGSLYLNNKLVAKITCH